MNLQNDKNFLFRQNKFCTTFEVKTELYQLHTACNYNSHYIYLLIRLYISTAVSRNNTILCLGVVFQSYIDSVLGKKNSRGTGSSREDYDIKFS